MRRAQAALDRKLGTLLRTHEVRKAGAPEVTPKGNEPAVGDSIDFEKSIDTPAPGVTDDASGVAVVVELAPS